MIKLRKMVLLSFVQQIVTPEVLYEKVVEVECRVIPASAGKCQLDNKKWRRVKGSTGEDLFVTRELDEEKLKLDLEELRRSGIESLAVVLAHSYTFVTITYIYIYAPITTVTAFYYSYFIIHLRYGEHEIRVGELAKLVGFPQVSLSHEIMPMARIVPRGFTACADAYLTPHIKRYLRVFFFFFLNTIIRTIIWTNKNFLNKCFDQIFRDSLPVSKMN